MAAAFTYGASETVSAAVAAGFTLRSGAARGEKVAADAEQRGRIATRQWKEVFQLRKKTNKKIFLREFPYFAIC